MPRIPIADRIPTGQKFAFSLGVNMEFISANLMFYVLWMPVFNIGLGISPAILGGILMLFRAWDAITDPVMGNISDNARTRWGRRRPFMFAGAISTACLYPLFWYIPAGWGDAAKVGALIAVGLVYFCSFTLWTMPYYGLQLELTPNYDERTRLAAYQGGANCVIWTWRSVAANFRIRRQASRATSRCFEPDFLSLSHFVGHQLDGGDACHLALPAHTGKGRANPK